jgi:hypothetical protein
MPQLVLSLLLLLQVVVVLCGSKVNTVRSVKDQMKTVPRCRPTFGSIDATDIGS